MSDKKPNILFIMTDQQRADTIASLGNEDIYTPNFDRLVRRGAAFTNAYSTCPVCVPARYVIRTGCEPHTTAVYDNGLPALVDGQPREMEQRCGPYLARTLTALGYRTFHVGKSHTHPWNEDIGYQTQLDCRELYGSREIRETDAYAAFIAREHPEYDWIEQLRGERTEMYYMPQMSPLPAELTMESWITDRAVEQIGLADERPYFLFCSFLGPHPPFSPPIPFNRMYDPDRLPNPVCGDVSIDHMDDYLPWMNHWVFAEGISEPHARVLKSRYYGEITYIDQCLGRLLDAVEAGPDADNTLICFYSDHGDHLGDHRSWQKESFFEASCRVPFLVSWPNSITGGQRRDDLVCLTDLFGIATTAAGTPDLRQGVDVLGVLDGRAPSRERLIGLYGTPGTPLFKVMVREGEWKYIFIANGGREQLFNVAGDPCELNQRLDGEPEIARKMHDAAVEAVSVPNADRALECGSLKSFPFVKPPRTRVYQFDGSRGVKGFPAHPQDLLQPGA